MPRATTHPPSAAGSVAGEPGAGQPLLTLDNDTPAIVIDGAVVHRHGRRADRGRPGRRCVATLRRYRAARYALVGDAPNHRIWLVRLAPATLLVAGYESRTFELEELAESPAHATGAAVLDGALYIGADRRRRHRHRGARQIVSPDAGARRRRDRRRPGAAPAAADRSRTAAASAVRRRRGPSAGLRAAAVRQGRGAGGRGPDLGRRLWGQGCGPRAASTRARCGRRCTAPSRTGWVRARSSPPRAGTRCSSARGGQPAALVHRRGDRRRRARAGRRCPARSRSISGGDGRARRRWAPHRCRLAASRVVPTDAAGAARPAEVPVALDEDRVVVDAAGLEHCAQRDHRARLAHQIAGGAGRDRRDRRVRR